MFLQESSSNATLVLIRNVSFGLSGNFSCEVTADAPLYSTATAYAQMQVVGEYRIKRTGPKVNPPAFHDTPFSFVRLATRSPEQWQPHQDQAADR